MDRDFVVDILPTVERFARKVFGPDDDKVTLAGTLAWHAWAAARPEQKELPASVWARAAVRKVVSGRDLPGVQASHFRDIWENAERWEGGDMNLTRDRAPGPERLAEEAEAYARFKAALNEQERKMVEAVEADLNVGTFDLAELLGRSPGRISQMRRELLAKWRA